jgi:hypothetical protein
MTMSEGGDPNGRRLRPWLLGAAYLALFGIGIPWYWPQGSTALWFGMPAWVVMAVAASVGVSVLTAIVLRQPWPGEEEAEQDLRHAEEDAQ